VFAAGAGLGVAPVIVSLAMLLTYGVITGAAYAALGRES
jgi:hypothetical protein